MVTLQAAPSLELLRTTLTTLIDKTYSVDFLEESISIFKSPNLISHQHTHYHITSLSYSGDDDFAI